MKVLILIGILLMTGCAKCVQSHKEIQHRSAYTMPRCLIWNTKGGCTIWVYDYHPAEDVEVTVCDKYEK
jgi:hypothetical protein